MVNTWIGELLIGEGFWLGLLIIISILFVVSSMVKHFNIIGSMFCLVMVFYYNANLTASELKIWGMVIMGLTPLFLFFIGSKN